MRITRDNRGQFRVEDQPMRVEGRAAERFIADMRERERRGVDADHQRRLEESRRVYRDAERQTA